jgi:TRAP-type C4-dicarboxylate transport system permease small subunit
VKRIPLVRIGFLVALSPIIAAFLYSLINGGSMFNESSGGGAYLWFLMASLPIGFVMIVTGLILFVVNKLKPKDGTKK